MTKIVKNPDLNNPVREVSLASPGAEAQVRRLYEEGDLVILRDFRFDLDYRFLCSIDFNVDGPPEVMRKIKKFPMQRLEALDADAPGPLERFIFERVFDSDRGRLDCFREQVRSGDRQMQALFRRLFPGYADFKSIYSWRFTETMYENLHWDNFGTTDDFHQVRIFVNIDDRPRLWRISEDIESFARRSYADANLAHLRDDSADRLAYVLNNKVLGGLAHACLDQMPKHHLGFEQGEVWLCETRLVSHQIYSGYRAYAAMFYIDPASMDDPSRRFNERIRRLHEQVATA